MSFFSSLLANSDPFDWITSNATRLMAVAIAVRLGWIGRRGSQVIPGEEAIPRAWPRIVFLITAVLFALMYKFLSEPDRVFILTLLTTACLISAFAGLIMVTYLLKRYGVAYEERR